MRLWRNDCDYDDTVDDLRNKSNVAVQYAVDLLVVMDTDEEPIHAAARIAAAIDHPFALDVLAFKPSTLKASFERKGIFTAEVMMKGIILYEA